MQINPHVPFIPEDKLEALARRLLARYEREIESIPTPPVPVEQIADFLLELGIEWLDIPDTDDAPILAYLHPESKTIRLNERRLEFFEQYPGSYEYTLAHEIGHYRLHLTETDFQSERFAVYRHRQPGKDRREWQAERFASYLLMPEHLLLPAIENMNLQRWSELYRLRDRFKVSITALKIRLEELGHLYVAPNAKLYPSRSASVTERRQEMRKLIGQGHFFSTLGQVDRAKDAYRQALEIADELNDQKNTALLSWQLGLLYAETDPTQAVVLMSVCVAYERKIGHPNANVDAELVAQLQAKA